MSTVKTTVFNLIILDESGSMCDCTKATISGCNEVINVAQNFQKEHSDAQRSLISIYAFQDGGPVKSRYLCKNVDTLTAHHITGKDYKPYGNTPLYDAIGSTLVDLRAVASTHEDATAVVTIITDGMENSSTHFDRKRVRNLIEQLKEMGWTFNFIGANIDVDAVADDFAIDNRMAYEATPEGTSDMFLNINACMVADMESRVAEEACMSVAERVERRKLAAKKFFKK